METLFYYLIESSVCLALYEVFYWLFLRKETFHRMQRIMLLGSLWLAVCLPLLELPEWGTEALSVSGDAFPVWEAPIQDYLVVSLSNQTNTDSGTSLWEILTMIYFLGVALILLKNIAMAFYLSRILRQCHRKVFPDGCVVFVYPGKISPFSWLGNIILSEESAESQRAVVAHEHAHVLLHHSLDLLQAELLLCIQWFNPAAWLLKRDLSLVHEYEADRYVLSQGFDARDYQLLLIQKAAGPEFYTLTNRFGHHSLKKRILMMQRRSSGFWRWTRCLYALPVATLSLFLLAFSNPRHSMKLESNKPSAVSLSDTSIQTLYTKVDHVPSFVGGETALRRYVDKNLVYPSEAVAQGIEGWVLVTFIVNKGGQIVYPRVSRSAHPLLDAEALRLIREMPLWIAGRHRGRNVDVKYSLPIKFVLE